MKSMATLQHVLFLSSYVKNSLTFFFSFPLVLSSLTTGPVLTNVVPLTTDSFILVVFLLLLTAGIHCFVELCCWLVLLLAHRLLFKYKLR